MTGVKSMNLQIRNPRARELAEQLAEKRKVSMTEAVIDALEAELQRQKTAPLAERLKGLAQELASKSRGPGHDMTKEEIDRMWGHE